MAMSRSRPGSPRLPQMLPKPQRRAWRDRRTSSQPPNSGDETMIFLRHGSFSLGDQFERCVHAGAQLFEQSDIVLVWFLFEHQDRCLRFVEHVFDFFGPVAGVDRHDDRADARQREVDIGPFSIAGHPDGNFVAFADTQAQKAACDKIRCSLELVVRNRAALKHHGDFVAVLPRRLIERQADGFAFPLVGPHGAKPFSPMPASLGLEVFVSR